MSCALKDSQWKTKNSHKEDRNMQSLIPLIFIGLFAYLMFSRKGGGMGCCGGHGNHDSERHPDGNHDSERHPDVQSPPQKSIHNREQNVIDLREDEYTVLPSEKHKLQ
jgi:hypothetical protein